MLEKVRRSMQSGFTYVLVAGLTVIFMFFFGMPSQTCSGDAQQRRATLASVGGDTLRTQDVNLVFNRVFDDSGSSDDKEFRNKRARALRNLIAIEWFAQRAREEGFRIGEEEFKEFMRDPIRNLEYRAAYGRDGTFNGHYYRAYVQNRLRSTIETYEQFKREELLARKYLASRATQSVVPQQERDEMHKIKNTELNLEFVGFDAASLREGVDVDDEEVSTFLEENRDKVESHYKDNKDDKYSSPAELRVRRVYVARPGSDADESEKKKAKQKWKEAKKRVFDEEETIASVAKDLGDSGSDKGGLMSWSTAENMDSNITDALEGENVGTKKKVETDYAYMIAKLVNRREAETTPLEEVETDIARRLLEEQRAESRIEEVEKKLLEAAENNDSLSAALKSLRENSDDSIWSSLSAQTTGSFTLEGSGSPMGGMGMMGGSSWANIPKIGSSKKLAADAYENLTSDSPVADRSYSIEGTNYVVRLQERTSPDEESSPDQELMAKLRGKKAQKLLGRWRAIFMRPMNDYGTWIENQLQTAVEDGDIELYAKNSRVAEIAAGSFKPGGSASSPGGMMGNKKKALQRLKKKLKMKKKGKKGKKGGPSKSFQLKTGGGESGGGKGIQLKTGGKKGKSGESGGGKGIQLKTGGQKGKSGESGGGKGIQLKTGGGANKGEGGTDSPGTEGSSGQGSSSSGESSGSSSE